jgi:hypothetical protein
MSKNKKKKPIDTKESEQVDHFGRTLNWFKGNKMFAFIMFLAVFVIGLWHFSESLLNIYSRLKMLSARSPISVAAVTYLSEIAVDPTTEIPEAYHEIRDLFSNCRVVHAGFRPSTSKQRFTLSNGAEAQAEIKFRVLNTSGQRLTGVRLVLALVSFPLDFKRLTTTPNIIAEMSRPTTPDGGDEPYVIQIKELNSNDYAVITLIAPLTRKHSSDAFKIKFPLSIEILYMSSDQLPIIKDIKSDVINADDMIMLESEKISGHPLILGIKITPYSINEPYHKNDYPLLLPARDCPEKHYKTILPNTNIKKFQH